MKTTIIYGSMTGATEAVAEDLGTAFGGASVIAASDATEQNLKDCDLLILGASTWGDGELQDDMAAFLDNLKNWPVDAKVGAVFGLGDQYGYSDTYVDGMADMAEALKNKGLKLAGSWPAAGYAHSASRAQQNDMFAGLALDQDNESEKTIDRLTHWIEQIKMELVA